MRLILLFCCIATTLAPALAGNSPPPPIKPGQEVQTPIIDKAGNEIGTATFTSSPKGVKVAVEAQGLPPGLHGIHVHDKGVCDPSEAFASSGDHFAPKGHSHGLLNKKGPHAGDLPNLAVKADGSAHFEARLKDTSLNPADPHSLLRPSGTALIIHAGPDDQASDPAGKSGDRIACAIIASPRG